MDLYRYQIVLKCVVVDAGLEIGRWKWRFEDDRGSDKGGNGEKVFGGGALSAAIIIANLLDR